MNVVTIDGYLGRDPEMKGTTENPVCKLRIAVKHRGKTTWVNAAVFNRGNDKQATNCGEFLKSGSKVAVRGQLQEDNWTDKNGTKHNSLEVIADYVEFGPKGNNDTKE